MAFSRKKAQQLYKDGQQPDGNTFGELFDSVVFKSEQNDMSGVFDAATDGTALSAPSKILVQGADGSVQSLPMSLLMGLAASNNLGRIDDVNFDPGTPATSVNYAVKPNAAARTFAKFKDANGVAITVPANTNGTMYSIGAAWDFVPMVLPDDVLTSAQVGISGGVAGYDSFKQISDAFKVGSDGSFNVVDANGNIGLKLLLGILYLYKLNVGGQTIDSTLINSLIDVNSNVGPLVDNIVIGADNSFNVVDANKNIAFKIDKSGNLFGSPSIDFAQRIGGIINTNTARLVLPKQMYVVAKQICEINFENILKGGYLQDYYLYVSRLSKNRDKEIIRATTAGTITKTLTLEDKNQKVLSQKSVSVIATDTTKIKTINLLVHGDSKTENTTKLAELQNLANKDGNLTLNFVGKNYSAAFDSDGNWRNGLNHEGYSGRNIIDLVTSPTLNGNANIFYNASLTGSYKYDFAQGVATLGVVPDIVFVDHGANQTNTAFATVQAAYEWIVNQIKAYNSANGTTIKIVISIQEQNGLVNYIDGTGDGKTWFDRQSNPEAMLAVFDNRQTEGIYLCPQYLYVDPWNDYPYAYVPRLVGRNKVAEMRVALDQVHPGVNMGGYSSTATYNFGDRVSAGRDSNNYPIQAEYVALKNNMTGVPLVDDKINWAKTEDGAINAGYYKIADAYYATIRYIVSQL